MQPEGRHAAPCLCWGRDPPQVCTIETQDCLKGAGRELLLDGKHGAGAEAQRVSISGASLQGADPSVGPEGSLRGSGLTSASESPCLPG